MVTVIHYLLGAMSCFVIIALSGLLLYGQSKGKGAADSLLALDGYSATVCFHQAFGHGKVDAAAASIRRAANTPVQAPPSFFRRQQPELSFAPYHAPPVHSL
jgi:hypothetical protein